MMFRTFLALLWILVAASPSLAQAPANKGRLLFFGVAYDGWPPKGFTVDHYNWAPDNFAALLSEQAKDTFSDVKVAMVKGKQATKKTVLAKLAALRQSARPGDLAFIYWGTHGATEAKGYNAGLPPNNEVIWGGEIREELAKFPCPAIVVMSSCGSGGFAKPHGDEVPVPRNLAAFCACRRKQSTTNEMDRSLLEALAGFGDANKDGFVTLGETTEYVYRRYREFFRDSNDDGLVPVIVRSEGVSADLPLTKVGANHVAAYVEDGWYGAKVLETKPNKSKLRFLGFDATTPKAGFTMLDAWVKEADIFRDKEWPPVEVEQDGQWWAAKIKAKAKEGYDVHYMGYPDSDDEIVKPNRVRFLFGVRPNVDKHSDKTKDDDTPKDKPGKFRKKVKERQKEPAPDAKQVDSPNAARN